MKSDINKIKEYLSKSMEQDNKIDFAGNEYKDGYYCASYHKASEILAFIEGIECRSKTGGNVAKQIRDLENFHNDIEKSKEDKRGSLMCECGCYSRSHVNYDKGCDNCTGCKEFKELKLKSSQVHHEDCIRDKCCEESGIVQANRPSDDKKYPMCICGHRDICHGSIYPHGCNESNCECDKFTLDNS